MHLSSLILQDEHRQKLELEALARQQAAQQQLPQPQVKLAPWAKASEENISRDLSLFEIQVVPSRIFAFALFLLHSPIFYRGLKKDEQGKSVLGVS